MDKGAAAAGSVGAAMCELGFSAVAMRRLPTGHQIADIHLNGRQAVFVVDTGANMTVLDARYAQEFGLKPSVGVTGFAMGLGGGLQARAWRVDSLDIGAVRTRQGRIMTADLRQMTGLLDRMSSTRIAGIVGQDVLRAHRGVVDVARSTLFLAPGPGDPAPVSRDQCRAGGGGSRD